MAKKKYNPNWRKGMLAKAHMGKKQLGLDDDTYRNMLADRYDVDSAGDLRMDQLDDLVNHMESLGASFAKTKKSAKKYVRKIYALWGELEAMGVIEKSGKEPCIAWVKRQTGVDNPDWLDVDQASKAIEALKDWIEREGGTSR
jgi:phage gp16-like protein